MNKKVKDLINSLIRINKKLARKSVLDFFLNSRDFNGIPTRSLCEKFAVPYIEEIEDVEEADTEVLLRFVSDKNYDQESFSFKKLLSVVEKLVKDEEVTVVYDLNPHIKRYPDQPIEKQLVFLKEKIFSICLYPSSKYLKELNPDGYEDLPFKRKMLMGCPQVFPIYFELKILEEYANDPRFHFDFSDYSGHASIKEEYDSSDITLDRDRTFIERFGIGYRLRDHKRVAILWVTDLANFTSDHQKRWETYKIEEDCEMDPDFYKNQVEGAWSVNVGIYSAFLKEIEVINSICEKAGLPKLFKKIFREHPSGFRLPFISTSRNYHNFARVLDKLLSENLNPKFFKRLLEEGERFETVANSETGAQEVIRLGTINLLDKYIKKSFRPHDGFDQVDEMIDLFKKIRRLRSDESHRLLENEYSIDFDKKHDKLMDKAYDSVRLLRLIFSNHPSVKGQVRELMPDWLYEGKVRNYYFYSLDEVEL